MGRKVKRITASFLPVLAECPSGPSLPQAPQRRNKYGAIGDKAHEYYQFGKEEHDTFLEVPRFKRPEERTWAEVRHEWRLGWNFKTNEFIMLPPGLQPRDYGDSLPSDCYGRFPKEQWLMGSVDAMWIDDGVMYIEDLKTGAPVEPLCHQAVFLAKVASEFEGHAGPVSLGILNATRYGYVGEAKNGKKSKHAGMVANPVKVLSRAELEEHWLVMAQRPTELAVKLAEEGDVEAVQAAAVVNKKCYQSCGGKPWCGKYRATAKSNGLETLDRMKAEHEAAQEAARDEQSERDESCSQGNHGSDTTGHNGGGAGEREAPGVDEAQ